MSCFLLLRLYDQHLFKSQNSPETRKRSLLYKTKNSSQNTLNVPKGSNNNWALLHIHCTAATVFQLGPSKKRRKRRPEALRWFYPVAARSKTILQPHTHIAHNPQWFHIDYQGHRKLNFGRYIQLHWLETAPLLTKWMLLKWGYFEWR